MATRVPNSSPEDPSESRPKRRPRSLGHWIAIALWFVVVLWLTLPIAVSLVKNIFLTEAAEHPGAPPTHLEQPAASDPTTTPVRPSRP